MVTWRSGLVVSLLLCAACGGRAADEGSGPFVGSGSGSAEEGASPKVPPGTVDPGGAGPQYPGNGFIVHEWGTNTVVVGSDGSLQRGLHHEEEDLPSFVYDRKKTETIARSHVEVKMETPVTYFYSDRPLAANVNVRFPEGVLTQWYPGVASYFPWVLKDKGDPALDRAFPFSTPECRVDFSQPKNGLLDWGRIQVLARDAKPALPEAPLADFTWSHARDVASNPVRVSPQGPDGVQLPDQEERFLFYRGLGNFPIDMQVDSPARLGDDGGLVLTNRDPSHAGGAVFVLRVEGDRAAFLVHPEGVAPGKSLVETAPPATQPLDAYAQDLAKAMVAELDKAGLYHDESIGMVKTWARQWFRTPGVRVLYLAPQAWTDRQIPLSISPTPQETVRVMVIRVEVITRKQERLDLVAAADLDGVDAARARGEAYFQRLGRFAEPRLRRALAQTKPQTGSLAYLDKIAGANVSMRAGE